MSRELSAASVHFRSALDRYARSCFAARDACIGGSRVNNTHDLTASLEKESNDIASYFQTLEETRAAVHIARGSVPRSTCANNKLPVEILSRIFRFLPHDNCLVQRNRHRQTLDIKYSLFPDSLAHVCSYWRRVAIASPYLWTHIDITLDHSLNPGLFARAREYAIRAGHLSLEVHISDPGSEREIKRGAAIRKGILPSRDAIYHPSHNWSDLHDFKFLPSDSVAIKSLELDLMIDSRYREVYYSVLEYFFARCIPGILVQYLVRCVGAIPVDSRSFIEPVDAPHSLDGSLLDVPSGQLEEVWQSIAVVRVSGLCPHWTSKAYHGLVELYLDPGISDITESQLVGIFRASPKLQVFHLKTVVEPSENGLAIVPVYLEDLRDIMIMVQSDDNFSGILTLLWINPGSASLQMSFAGTPWGEISDFFDRSNITRFYLIHWEPCNLTRVFKESSRLETLVLNGRDFDVEDLSSLLNPHHVDNVNPDEAPPTPRRVQIDALYLLWFNGFIFEEIQAVVEKYSVQKLLIYGGKLSYQAVEGRVVSDNARNTRIKLSSITACPVIEYYYDANLIHQHCDDWMADALIY